MGVGWVGCQGTVVRQTTVPRRLSVLTPGAAWTLWAPSVLPQGSTFNLCRTGLLPRSDPKPASQTRPKPLTSGAEVSARHIRTAVLGSPPAPQGQHEG